MKRIVFLTFFLILAAFVPKPVRAACDNKFSCTWTGLDCQVDVNTSACNASQPHGCENGYVPLSSACSGLSMGDCQAAVNNNCVRVAPLTTHYSCQSGTCLQDPNGVYESLDACNKACQGTTQKYSCGQSGCVIDPNGTLTYSQCENQCRQAPPPANTFECRWDTTRQGCTVGQANCFNGYLPNSSRCVSLGQDECSSSQFPCESDTTPAPPVPPGPGETQGDPRCNNNNGIRTAIGCIPFTDQTAFMSFVLRWAFGIGGGIAFLLILYAGFLIMTSTGNPERVKAGQELLTSALAGLILLIFSVFVLKLIGVDILHIPGL